jgi:hypothetical protein
MLDKKTSLLINRQVPEFVREENPLFIAFLEAYYEYLENKQGTEFNDLVKRAKDLRDLSDVDSSIDDFEEAFFNMYASIVPRDIAVDKALLIKNVLPLYLAKGSENAFKLLFRMLFGSELTVTYPRTDVLRASDGKWLIENYVKVSTDAFGLYTGDGTTKVFRLAPCRCPITTQPLPIRVSVYINDVLQNTSTYFVRSELKKLYFLTAPANGATIRVEYVAFDFDQIVNRKITGLSSGTTALIERVGNQIINNKRVEEFYVDNKSVDGEFSIGETIQSDVIDADGNLVNIYFRGLSSVLKVNVIDGGSNYIVGDAAVINAPGATSQPKAVISKVFSGAINRVSILEGGAGFQVPDQITAAGYSTSELLFAIGAVEANTANSVANSYYIYSNIISDVDPANTTINALDWNFPSNTSIYGKTNANTVIAQALSNATYTLIGGISNVAIITSNVILSLVPDLSAEPADIVINPLTANTSGQTSIKIDTFGSLGKLIIRDGGEDYQVGDELTFTNPKNRMAFGIGAEAEVSNVSIIGRITEIKMLPPKLTGTVNVFSLSNTTIQGNNTTFLSDLAPGDLIVINTANTGASLYETRKVVAVDSDTSLNVNTAFSLSFVEQRRIRKVGKYPIGGTGYKPDRLPSISIVSANGTGANIIATCVMGDGEILEGLGTKRPGEIEEITVLDPGSGITIIPTVDLSLSGDRTATANVSLAPTYDALPGRWTNSDGILSSDRKLQGRNFYVNYSYLTSSFVEFSKYKNIFKDLLHPSGFAAYAEWETFDTLPEANVSLSTLVAPTNVRTLSGTVNIANASIIVTGTGTKFNVANDIGLITIGSYIAINSDIRIVNAIISNTQLTVSVPFSVTANVEELIVINTAYEAIATEVTLDEIIAENELILSVES